MHAALEIDEGPRPLRYGDAGAADPLSLLLEQARKDQQAIAGLLAAVAGEHFQLRHALREADAAGAGRAGSAGDAANAWRAVAIIADRLAALLAEAGVTTREPAADQPWSEAVAREYDLVAFVQRPGAAAPRVVQVDAPAVFRFDRLVRKGKVIVEAPAPATAPAAPATVPAGGGKPAQPSQPGPPPSNSPPPSSPPAASPAAVANPFATTQITDRTAGQPAPPAAQGDESWES